MALIIDLNAQNNKTVENECGRKERKNKLRAFQFNSPLLKKITMLR
jgi:hypothetical protein